MNGGKTISHFEVLAMEVQQVLRMNGGDGKTSYTSNSLIQKQAMLKAKPILQESITELFCKKFQDSECIKMADLGCSSGPNTLFLVRDIIDIIDEKCLQLNIHKAPPVFQVFLNDLPGNDFNTIFKSLPSFYEKLQREKGREFGPCFIAAMPGSFYGRLFPNRFLHFVHSSYSLHWLSQVPAGLIDKEGNHLNKGNIYIAKTSPGCVLKAYYDAFERDFTFFLRSRSEEMISGGHMILTIVSSDDHNKVYYSSGDYRCTVWELLGITLHEMSLEGLIEEAKLDSFNLPYYAPTAEEVKHVIEAEGSFKLKRDEVFRVDWDAKVAVNGTKSLLPGEHTRGKKVAMNVRAVAESLLESHFGDEMMDCLFQRYAKKIEEYLEVKKGECITMVISVIKD